MTLESLYEDALRRSPYSQAAYSTGNPNQNATAVLALPAPPGSYPGTGAVQPSFSAVQDPFAASFAVAPPPSVQMAQMAQQQQMLFGPHHGYSHQQHYSQPHQLPAGNVQTPVPQGPAGGYYGTPGVGSQVGYGGHPAGTPGLAQNPFQTQFTAGAPLTPGAQGQPQFQSNPFGNPNLL